MSLVRLLIFLFSAVLLVLTLVVGTTYYFSWLKTRELQNQQLHALANVTASQLASRSRDLVAVVEGLSQDPGIANALTLGGEVLQFEERQAQQVIPSALLVRLLPKGSYSLDEARKPAMGYADLDLVHQAEIGEPPPVAHAFASSDRHIAVARAIKNEGETIGVLLASISLKWLQASVPAPEAGALALRQGDLTLAFKGNSQLQSEPDNGHFSVAGTPWEIRFWVPAPQLGNTLTYGITWIAALAVMGILFYFGLRKVRSALRKDETTFYSLVNDLVAGQAQGSYSVILQELQPLINRLMHLNRRVVRQSPQITVEEAGEKPAALPEKGEEKPAATQPATFSEPEPEEHAINVSEDISVPEAIFRAYDIRGVVGEDLSPDILFVLGRAIGSEAYAQGDQSVIVARDKRESSAEYARALMEGIKSSGRDVIDLGPAPTSLVYFATQYLTSRSGVMVTASHNPAKYNGLKIVLGGEPCHGEKLKQLKQRIDAGDFTSGMGALESQDLTADYIGAVVEDIQIGRPLKVVVDCGGGAADPLVPMLLRTLGCEVMEIHTDRDPDPTHPEALKELIARVKSDTEVELGLAFDGDGDRMTVVDSEGKMILPDQVLMVLAADVLSREPGGDIVFDVKCSRHLAGYIVQHGGRPVMSASGYGNIRKKMEEVNAVMGGEFSGHLVIKERWYGFDDAVYGAARLLEVLSAEPFSPAEVFAELPESVATPQLSVEMNEGSPAKIMQALSSSVDTYFTDAKVSKLDGLRVDFADGWGLVRASNTTPSLVFRFEADDEEALARIQTRFKEWLETLDEPFDLPFGNRFQETLDYG